MIFKVLDGLSNSDSLYPAVRTRLG